MPKGASVQTSSRKPKLGQHFLASEAAALRIVEALGDVSEATVLEIGPGRGAITDLLARKARRLIAVELDRVLSAQLRMKFSMQPNVEIIEGDILTIELDTVFGAKPGSLAHRPELRARTGPRCRQPAVLHHLRYSAAPAGISPLLFDHCHHGAERSCRPPGGFGGKPRLWLAFGDGAAVRPGRATLHASARAFVSAAQGSFERGSHYHQAATGSRCGFRRPSLLRS